MKILFFIIIFSFPFITKANSQLIERKEFLLKSIENKDAIVRIELNSIDDFIKFSLNNKENLCIHDFRELIQEIRIIDKKFLEVIFKIRGGTGVSINRYLLLCVSDNKIFEAIDILSSVVTNLDVADLQNENNSYNLKFKVVQQADNFELQIDEYDTLKNTKNRDLLSLKFNKQLKVFYNSIKHLRGSFIIDSGREYPSNEKKIDEENIFSIILNHGEYYFLRGKWYIKDDVNHLTEFSNFCD